jgi:hypothetical protein
VRLTRLGPLADERSEVAAVARDEDAVVFSGEAEDVWVVEALEWSFLGQRHDIVAPAAEGLADASRRQVRVEQQAHVRLRAGAGEFDERVELAPLLNRLPVLRDRLVHLGCVGVAVRLHQPQMALGQLRLAHEPLA